MKSKIIIVCCIFGLFSKALAQEPVISYYKEMKEATKTLDSTKFKNNILYDRVYPLAKLNEFNQNQKIDTSSVSHFMQATHELDLASNKKSTLINAEKLQQIIYNANYQNKVEIGIINYDITVLKNETFNAINPLMRVDSTAQIKKYFELPTKNPYQNKQCLVIAALQETIIQDQNPIIFSIGESFLQETTYPIQNLYIDFGDGQPKHVIANGIVTQRSISYKFMTSGAKIITFSGNFSNGVTFETKSKSIIKLQTVLQNPSTKCESSIIKLRTNVAFTPYESEPLPYNVPTNATIDQRPEIEYKIFYSGANCILKKPILIIDGFDPGDKRSIDYIYYNSLEQKDNQSLKLGNRLRDLGYDVVIANFPVYKIASWRGPINSHEPEIINKAAYRDAGADYIQRNAGCIENLIKILNASLVANNSTEKLVVVGPSMGGLISRWALKSIEDKGENHNTKLWVSFDSPHQGANLPLSVQYLSEYGNDFSALDKLNRPATKQMLVQHYTCNTSDSGGAPYFRDRFATELATLCYPINNIRKIAMVNGVATGVLNNQPGQLFISVHSWMTTFPWGNAAFGELNFSGDAGSGQVFKMREKSGAFSWSETLRHVNSNYTIGSYDTATGCKYSLIGDSAINDPANIVVDFLLFFKIRVSTSITTHINNFTFMPTKSTLDFKGSSSLLKEPFNNRNLVTTHETPFDAYYTPPVNEEHVELNTANVNWLLNQLSIATNTNVAQNNVCGYRPATLSINGSNNLCDVIQRTYTLDPSNLTNIQWSGSNIQFLSSNNQEARVRKINSTLSASITATCTSGGGNVQAYKFLTCNRPNLRFALNYENNLNIKVKLADMINEMPLINQNITNVQWDITSGNGQLLDYNNTEAVINGTNFTGVVTATNDEGETYTRNFFWPDPNSCKAITKIGFDKYQVINRCDNNSIVEEVSAKEIYNMMGYKIGDLPLSTDEININTGNTGDIQLIHIISEGENLTKRIVKD